MRVKITRRRTSEQDTTRELSTELGESSRVLEEFNDFVQFELGFFDSVNIGERRPTSCRIGGVCRYGCEGSSLLRRSKNSRRVEEE